MGIRNHREKELKSGESIAAKQPAPWLCRRFSRANQCESFEGISHYAMLYQPVRSGCLKQKTASGVIG